MTVPSHCDVAPPDPAGGERRGADDLTEAALLARGGDRNATRHLVSATQPMVWRFLANLADRTVAEDLTQETYERAFTALPAYRGEASARTWLLSIARRVAADHLRRTRRRPALADAPVDDEQADRAVLAAPGDHAEHVVLEALLARLATLRREAFTLTQIVGLDYHETARVLGCPVGTVRSRVARARADLAAALHADDDAPAGTVVPDSA